MHAPSPSQIFGAYNGGDGILSAMEAVRRAVLSPDDLLGYNLLFVRSRFSCRSMPSDNNVNLTQVHFHQKNTRASSLGR